MDARARSTDRVLAGQRNEEDLPILKEAFRQSGNVEIPIRFPHPEFWPLFPDDEAFLDKDRQAQERFCMALAEYGEEGGKRLITFGSRSEENREVVLWVCQLDDRHPEVLFHLFEVFAATDDSALRILLSHDKERALAGIRRFLVKGVPNAHRLPKDRRMNRKLARQILDPWLLSSVEERYDVALDSMKQFGVETFIPDDSPWLNSFTSWAKKKSESDSSYRNVYLELNTIRETNLKAHGQRRFWK